MLDLLAAGAAGFGLPLTAAQLARFATYASLLLEWNARDNLTAITEPAAIQTLLFVDSLAVAAALVAGDGPNPPTPFPRREGGAVAGDGPNPPTPFPRREGGDGLPSPLRGGAGGEGGRGLIDLGTGAGFPGLPLKILWPELPLTLVDSAGKKTAFLAAVVAALGLDGVTVLTARAEALGQEKAHRGVYDVATARAVASLAVLAEYGLPLCRVGGVLLAPKKGDLAAEQAQAAAALPKLGGGPLSVYPYRLPDEDAPRVVVRMPKVAPTPPGYPRRVGLPKQRPLGA